MQRFAVSLAVVALSWPIVSPQEPTVLAIETGDSVRLRMSKQQEIISVHNERPKVCFVTPIQGDATGVVVVGISPGESRIVCTDAKKRTESFLVIVRDEKGVAPLPGEFEVIFFDGSIVRLKPQMEKLEMESKAGRFTINIKDVREIEFGLRFPPNTAMQIADASNQLSGKDFRERERAMKTLTSLGPWSYSAGVEASRNPHAEVARRAVDVVKALHHRHPTQDLKLSPEDRVITADSTIVGRIQAATLKAKSELFGEIDLPLAKMRSMRIPGKLVKTVAD